MGPRQSKIINKKNQMIISSNIIYCKYCNKKLFINNKEKICDTCEEKLVIKRLKAIGFI
jgi:DNA-directed RNA polymerase subunit RPC12/RpoP